LLAAVGRRAVGSQYQLEAKIEFMRVSNELSANLKTEFKIFFDNVNRQLELQLSVSANNILIRV